MVQRERLEAAPAVVGCETYIARNSARRWPASGASGWIHDRPDGLAIRVNEPDPVIEAAAEKVAMLGHHEGPMVQLSRMQLIDLSE
jgi:hypothetical protein